MRRLGLAKALVVGKWVCLPREPVLDFEVNPKLIFVNDSRDSGLDERVELRAWSAV